MRIITTTAIATIKAGSPNVTISKRIPNLKPGDKVFFTGDYKPGEIGPGGTYPEALYKTEKEMQADLSHEHSTWGANLQTKLINSFDKYQGKWIPSARVRYYLEKFLPLANIVTVLSISSTGRKLVVDKPFRISGKCTFYVDNAKEIVDYIKANGFIEFPKNARIPVASKMEFIRVSSKIIKSNGAVLFSPPLVPSISMQFIEGGYNNIDVELEGNAKPTGFGFVVDPVPGAKDDNLTQKGWYNDPFINTPALMVFSDYNTINLKVKNALGYGYKVAGKGNSASIDATLEDGEFTYQGWHVLQDGSSEEEPNIINSLKFKAGKMSRALENAKGFAQVKNASIINGICAANSGPINIDGLKMLITEDSYNASLGKPPLFDCNTFLEPGANRVGGFLKGIHVVNKDKVNLYPGVVAREGTKNFEIDGFIYEKGDATDENDIPAGIHIPADGARVKNVRITGKVGKAYKIEYIDENHTPFSLYGPGEYEIENVEAQFITIDKRATAKK